MKNYVVRVRLSLSKIAREKLVNYDDATVYLSDKNPDIS